MSRTALGIGLAAWLLVAGAPAATAGARVSVADDRSRVETRCSRGSEAELRLRVRGSRIGVELDIDVERPGGSWRVIVLHERRTAFRGTLQPGGSGSIRLRRTVPNWFGTDTVTVRATAARGETCRADGRRVGVAETNVRVVPAMEPRGLEPLTFWLPARRSPS